MKRFEWMMAAVGLAATMVFCGCHQKEAARRVPLEDYRGGMAHQGIRPGKNPPAAGATAVAELEPASGSQVRGTIVFTKEDDGVRMEGSVTGLTPGLHGFHIHANGDCSAPDAKSAGDHFNPTDRPHGGPGTDMHHVGDFGNITADAAGVAKVSRVVGGLTLAGPDSIVGRAVIVHASEDDLKSQPSGNSGARVACGVIRAH